MPLIAAADGSRVGMSIPLDGGGPSQPFALVSVRAASTDRIAVPARLSPAAPACLDARPRWAGAIGPQAHGPRPERPAA